MTRKEKIKEVAQKEMSKYPNFCITAPAFRMGAEWADSHPHWISVDDELPRDGEYVLICNKRGLMTTSLYENEEWVISETYLAVEVSHWMPLPQPPKEGGEE